jgi:hypothetical protein
MALVSDGSGNRLLTSAGCVMREVSGGVVREEWQEDLVDDLHEGVLGDGRVGEEQLVVDQVDGEVGDSWAEAGRRDLASGLSAVQHFVEQVGGFD